MSLELWCPLGLEARASRRGATSATVVRTGMGPRRAAAFARRRNLNSDRIAIVLGLGGALDDGLAPGDVVVAGVVRGPGPDRVAAVVRGLGADRLVGVGQGREADRVAGSEVSRGIDGGADGHDGTEALEALEALVARLRAAGLNAIAGPVRSAGRPVIGGARRRLAGDGCLVADMESWWLLAAQPPPAAVVRVVCDTPRAEMVSLSFPPRVRGALATLASTVEPLEAWARAPESHGTEPPENRPAQPHADTDPTTHRNAHGRSAHTLPHTAILGGSH